MSDEETKKIRQFALAKSGIKIPTYKASVVCLNCGWSGQVEVEKGVKVHSQPCPNCECKFGETHL